MIYDTSERLHFMFVRLKTFLCISKKEPFKDTCRCFLGCRSQSRTFSFRLWFWTGSVWQVLPQILCKKFGEITSKEEKGCGKKFPNKGSHHCSAISSDINWNSKERNKLTDAAPRSIQCKLNLLHTWQTWTKYYTNAYLNIYLQDKCNEMYLSTAPSSPSTTVNQGERLTCSNALSERTG